MQVGKMKQQQENIVLCNHHFHPNFVVNQIVLELDKNAIIQMQLLQVLLAKGIVW